MRHQDHHECVETPNRRNSLPVGTRLSDDDAKYMGNRAPTVRAANELVTKSQQVVVAVIDAGDRI